MTAGVQIADHSPDGPPLSEHQREQSAHRIELRDSIRAETIGHGQIEACGNSHDAPPGAPSERPEAMAERRLEV